MRCALRASREAMGLTQAQIAEAMEWSVSKVVRIETGEVTISATDLRRLLAYVGVTDRDAVESLVTEAKASRRRNAWWAQPRYRDTLPTALRTLIQYEADARFIRHFNLTLIPGLLQTREYAEMVLRAHQGDLGEEAIGVQLDAQGRRQRDFLRRARPVDYLILLDESVLYRTLGGPEVMSQQLLELLCHVHHHRIRLRVVPLARAAPVAVLGPFTLIDLAGADDVLLYRESIVNATCCENPHVLAQHRKVFEDLWVLALPEDQTASLLETCAREMAEHPRHARAPGPAGER